LVLPQTFFRPLKDLPDKGLRELWRGWKPRQVYIGVSPTSAQIQWNWFRPSPLATLVAIGLRKPFAKFESGTSLVMYDVCWLYNDGYFFTRIMMVTSLWDRYSWNIFPVSR
jgi:hypothetical protein